MKKVVLILSLLVFGLVIFSCKKITNPEPGPPVIAFKDFSIVKETEAYFHFTFTDPDGDIGLKDEDTTGAFAVGSPYYDDFHMKFQFKNYQGVFVDSLFYDPKTSQKDTIIYLYRIPFVTNNSKDKSLTGEIIVKMSGFRPETTLRKFRYVFYIYDRAHHKSNVITTPEFFY